MSSLLVITILLPLAAAVLLLLLDPKAPAERARWAALLATLATMGVSWGVASQYVALPEIPPDARGPIEPRLELRQTWLQLGTNSAGEPVKLEFYLGIDGISLSRNPDRAITAEQAALVNNLVTNKCDTLKEGFLNNPRACKVDFSVLKCQAGASGNSCLTDAQMKTVETFYGGVKNSKGELIFSGQALGNPINAQQATNQLVALSAKQQLQIQNLMAAQYRAEAMDQARKAETEQAARTATDRFLGPGHAYTPE